MSPGVAHLVVLGSMASILEAPVAAGAFALLSLLDMLCLSGSLVLSCYLVCFLIFTLVAANSRLSKLAEGVKPITQSYIVRTCFATLSGHKFTLT